MYCYSFKKTLTFINSYMMRLWIFPSFEHVFFFQEPRLHAAVFLEQSSYCYLLSKPPMLRKYGFHLVLAGSRYDLSDQVFIYRVSCNSYLHIEYCKTLRNTFNFVRSRENMQFGLTKMPSLFIKEALGIISMILSILTLEGKL